MRNYLAISTDQDSTGSIKSFCTLFTLADRFLALATFAPKTGINSRMALLISQEKFEL